MSQVYRCIDLRLGRAVAAKVMHDHLAEDPVFRTRFKREARAMAQLAHPNLVNIYDFSAEDPAFLIMELITGGTLRELLAERGPMPPHAATAVMRAVLTGLSAVHARGLVHRDIKPDNVLINGDHRVKLGDFGLVRAASREAVDDQIVGTVSYLAPEQVTGADITPAADVYSAGIVFYELLTGEVPFSGATPLEHAKARLSADLPAPSSRISGIPPLFDALVASATARSAEERFADAAEFLAALDDVASELALPAFSVPVPRNSAAARTAAQPTNFQGVAGVGGEDVFQPTTALPADEEDATEVLGDDNDATTVMAQQPLSDATRAGWAPVASDPPSDETRFDGPVQPAPGAPAAFDAPRLSFDSAGNQPQSYQPQAYQPGHAPAPAYSAHPVPAAPPAAAPGMQPGLHTAEEEPAPRVLSNRSPFTLALWLLIVGILTVAIAIGGWWFGSGNYYGVPVFWRV